MQVIKIWVSPDGTAYEKVFDVNGDPQAGLDLDTSTCTPSDDEGRTRSAPCG